MKIIDSVIKAMTKFSSLKVKDKNERKTKKRNNPRNKRRLA